MEEWEKACRSINEKHQQLKRKYNEACKEHEELKKKFGVQTIPIKKYEAEYNIGKLGMGSKATALQFPLKLSTACTCHKVGSTLCKM